MRTINSKDVLLIFTILFGIFLIISIFMFFYIYEGLENSDPTKNVTSAITKASPALQSASVAALPHLQKALQTAAPALKKAFEAAVPPLREAVNKASPHIQQATDKVTPSTHTNKTKHKKRR